MRQLLRFTLVVCSSAIAASGEAQKVEPQNSADSLSLFIAIYETALDSSLKGAYPGTELEVVCVMGRPRDKDPPREVITALEIRSGGKQLIRPMSACRVEESTDIVSPRSLIVDTLTSKRGIVISRGVPVFHDDGTFSVEVHYYQAMLAGATWACEGGRGSDRRWEIRSCRLTVVS